MGVGFVRIFQGSIFMAMTFGYNQHAVMLNLFQHPLFRYRSPLRLPRPPINRGPRNDGCVTRHGPSPVAMRLAPSLSLPDCPLSLPDLIGQSRKWLIMLPGSSGQAG